MSADDEFTPYYGDVNDFDIHMHGRGTQFAQTSESGQMDSRQGR